MNQSYDLVVVGGGIVGASVAYHAVTAGAQTLLVDGGNGGQATAAGAGILSVETNAGEQAPWSELARAAARHYPLLIEALGPAAETGYSQCGALVLAMEEEQAELLDRYRLRSAKGQGEDSDDFGELEEIDPEAAQDRFPVLARPVRAFFNRAGCRIDGQRMRDALLAAAQREGLELRSERVERLEIERDRADRVIVGSDAVDCGAVVLAAGAWTGGLAASAGVSIPVAPQRGQILHFGLADFETGDWPVVITLGDYYLVAWPGGRVVCGATRETGSGFDPRLTAAGVQQVLTRALALAPGLAETTLIEMRVGLRPLTRDLLPILGPVPGVVNLFVATGHGPTGLTLGPYSGLCLAKLALEGRSPFDLSPFRSDRPGLSPE